MSLRDAEDAYLAALPAVADRVAFARSEYERLDNRKLRHEMYREQRSICVFCERRINEGHPTPTIDHWHPLSIQPELALDWRNLYLSCPAWDTCNSAKGNLPLRWKEGDDDLPWPVDLRYEQVVGFTSLGELYVRSDVELPDGTRRALQLAIADCTDGAHKRKSIVHLNSPALKAARVGALDGERGRLNKDFRNKTASKDARGSRADEMLAQDPLPAFVSIRVAWLRKKLGLGR